MVILPPPPGKVDGGVAWTSWFQRVYTSLIALLFYTTSATATAGAAVLPTAPVGFIVVLVNGSSYKIPYYNV